jgi:hypothetical protein
VSEYFRHPIPEPLFRLHPSFGARPPWKEKRLTLSDDELPAQWRDLTLEEQDQRWDEWLQNLLLTVASSGSQRRIYADFSDKLGIDALLATSACRPASRPLGFICELTPEVGRALARTNVTDLVIAEGNEVILTASGSWDTVFLHAGDDAVLSFCRAEDG